MSDVDVPYANLIRRLVRERAEARREYEVAIGRPYHPDAMKFWEDEEIALVIARVPSPHKEYLQHLAGAP